MTTLGDARGARRIVTPEAAGGVALVVVWALARAVHAHGLQTLAGMVLVDLVPGLALVRALGFGDRGPAWRVFAAGALSAPLIAMVALVAGAFHRPIESVTWPLLLLSVVVLCAPTRLRVRHAGIHLDPAARTPEDTLVLLGGAALAGIVSLGYLHGLLLRWSDSWFHAALFNEVVRAGVHPGFPHFADMPVPYPWFFHVYLVAVRGLVSHDPFVLMATLNQWTAFLLPLGVFVLARRIGTGPRAAAWSALTGFLGVNAFGVILLVGRVMIGRTVGWPVIHETFSGTDPVMAGLEWNFPSFQTAWLSRLWTPTAFNFALMLGVLLLALVIEYWESTRASVFIAMVITLAFVLHWHTLTALDATVGILAGVGFAAAVALPRDGPRAFVIAGTVAVGVGAAYLFVRPYLALVTLGGSNPVMRLGFSSPNAWGFALSMGPAVLAAAWSYRRLAAETRVLVAGIALALLGTLLFFDLPGVAEEKLYYPLFLVVAAMSGPALVAAARGPAPARVALALALASSVATEVATAIGFIHDPRPVRAMFDREHATLAPLYTPDEANALAWIRAHTPPDAVFLQATRQQGTEPILVAGERRLFLGAAEAFYRATFFETSDRPPVPAPIWAELQRRAALQADVFSDRPLSAEDVADLTHRPWPLYVWQDTLLAGGVVSRTLRDTMLARRVFETPSVRVLAVRPASPSR